MRKEYGKQTITKQQRNYDKRNKQKPNYNNKTKPHNIKKQRITITNQL